MLGDTAKSAHKASNGAQFPDQARTDVLNSSAVADNLKISNHDKIKATENSCCDGKCEISWKPIRAPQTFTG